MQNSKNSFINNYFMPPEWAPHERTLIAWPVRDSMIWPDNYEEVSRAYAQIARAISEFEPVTMIVGTDTDAAAKALCGDSGNIEFLTIPHNDAWCRDNGPTFLLSLG
jgi:agmatine deiminase